MQTISINAVSAANELANAIEGYSDGVILLDRESGATAVVRPGRDFTEIRFSGDEVRSANVAIERPRYEIWQGGELRPAAVAHSSSSSASAGWQDAALSAQTILLAVQAAAILDEWAARGLLSRLDAEKAEATR